MDDVARMEPAGRRISAEPMAQSGKVRQAGPGFRKRSIRATGRSINVIASEAKQSISQLYRLGDGLLRRKSSSQ